MIKYDRLKELIGSLTRDDDTPERIDAYNEILNGFDSDFEEKLVEAEKKVTELENRYRTTFKSILEKDVGKTEETVISTKEQFIDDEEETTTTWEDIFKED